MALLSSLDSRSFGFPRTPIARQRPWSNGNKGHEDRQSKQHVWMGISGSYNGGTVPYQAISCGDIPLHRPYIGLTYGRYIQWIGAWIGHYSRNEHRAYRLWMNIGPRNSEESTHTCNPASGWSCSAPGMSSKGQPIFRGILLKYESYSSSSTSSSSSKSISVYLSIYLSI